jgi:hypothetical protein
LDKIASKFGKEVNEEAINIIKTIKLLINNKIKIDEIIDELENTINEIEGIKNIDELSDVINEITINKLRLVRVKIVGEKYRVIHINLDLFEKIGGRIPEGKDAYVIFEVFTEDGYAFDIIRTLVEIDTYERRGRLNFGAETIYDKIKKNELFLRVKGVVTGLEDFYNLYKEKIGEKDYGISIVEMLSYNKIRIIKGREKIEFDLRETELHWVSNKEALGIRGKIKIEESGDEAKIAIYSNGEETFVEIFVKDKEGEHGRRIKNIDFDENKLRIRYILAEGEERTYALYFIDPLSLVKEINNENGKWLTNKETVEAWFDAGSNTARKGAIGEKAGMKMSKYIPECETEDETAEGKPSDYSDVKMRLNGIPSPEEVKTCDLTGKSIEERNEIFGNRLREAIKQIEKNFEKERFKNSKAGIAIIIGFDKNKINPNAKYVEIEVLIVKVPSENPSDYEILSAPEWFKKS